MGWLGKVQCIEKGLTCSVSFGPFYFIKKIFFLLLYNGWVDSYCKFWAFSLYILFSGMRGVQLCIDA
jgi:hypothetical protein